MLNRGRNNSKIDSHSLIGSIGPVNEPIEIIEANIKRLEDMLREEMPADRRAKIEMLLAEVKAQRAEQLKRK